MRLEVKARGIRTDNDINMETKNLIVANKKGNESFRQKMLRKLYPTIKKLGKKGKKGTILINANKTQPDSSFYELEIIQNNGDTLKVSEFKGKQVVIVNTASNCGYTGQYAELQSLYERFGSSLVIVAFPANDFANQEKSDDKAIAQFCQVNYGVTFPVAEKGIVVKKPEQQAVFKWLTNKNLNGWNEHAPDWNFGKYIIDRNGVLTHYFGPSISPLEEDFMNALAESN